MAKIRARERARRWVVIVGLAGAVAASPGAMGLGAQGRGNGTGGGTGIGGNGAGDPPATPGFESTIDSIAADLTIRQWRVTTAGAPVGNDPAATSMRFEATRHGAGWRTSLTATGIDKPIARSLNGPTALDNPFLVSRMEFDDDGGMPRMYDVRGQLMAGPSDRDRRALGLPESSRDKTWDPSALLGRIGGPGRRVADRPIAGGLVAGVADKQKRREDLERRYGARAGLVRGFDQFLLKEGDRVHEVLVSADSSLPVEVNVTAGGALESHLQFDYEPHGPDAVVRRHLRAEQASAGSGGERAVTDVTVTNVTLGRRGAR